MTTVSTPVPLEQRRVLTTPIPGPRSVALGERRAAAVGRSADIVVRTFAEHEIGTSVPL